jgi:hypothetical protein
MVQIIYITESPRLFKKLRVYLDDGSYYDFGLDKSKTYLDHHDKQIRENYRLRHLGNAKEKELIENLIPSPSLFSYYLLWGDNTSLVDNIANLNSLFIKKYKSK